MSFVFSSFVFILNLSPIRRRPFCFLLCFGRPPPIYSAVIFVNCRPLALFSFYPPLIISSHPPVLPLPSLLRSLYGPSMRTMLTLNLFLFTHCFYRGKTRRCTRLHSCRCGLLSVLQQVRGLKNSIIFELHRFPLPLFFTAPCRLLKEHPPSLQVLFMMPPYLAMMLG